MNLFLLNVLLAFAWTIINGSWAPRDVAVGFVVGFLILWLVTPRSERTTYHGRMLQLPRFAAWYFCELIRSNVRVARDVLNPVLRNRPGIVAVPLDCRSDAEITAFANLVSLTPGTLSVSLSKDRGTLFVHFMDADPERLEDMRRTIKEGIERRVLKMSRPRRTAVDSPESSG